MVDSRLPVENRAGRDLALPPVAERVELPASDYGYVHVVLVVSVSRELVTYLLEVVDGAGKPAEAE